MTTAITDVDAFTNCVSPADNDQADAAMFLSCFQPVANRTRNLANTLTSLASSIGADIDALEAHVASTSNPHSVTAAQVDALAAHGVAVAGAPSASGKVLTSTSTSAASWQDPVAGGGGDTWTWSGSAARLAQSVTSGQLGQIGLQTDINRRYRLLQVTPSVVWGQAPVADGGVERAVTPLGNSTNNPSVSGSGWAATGGTAVARAPTTSSKGTMTPRYGRRTDAAAGSNIQLHGGSGIVPPPAAGVRATFRVVVAETSSTMLWFAGFAQAASANLGTLADCIGIGRSSAAQTNVQLLHNDSSGSIVPEDLGAPLPALGGGTPTLYELELYTADGTSWGYCVRNIETGAEASGALSTEIPATSASTFRWFLFASNGTDAVQVAVDLADIRWTQLVRS